MQAAPAKFQLKPQTFLKFWEKDKFESGVPNDLQHHGLRWNIHKDSMEQL